MAIASFTNPRYILYVIIYTGIIGGVMAFVMMIVKKELRRFLIKVKSKLMIASSYNKINIKDHSEKTYIPYAIAISLGTILTNILIK